MWSDVECTPHVMMTSLVEVVVSLTGKIIKMASVFLKRGENYYIITILHFVFRLKTLRR